MRSAVAAPFYRHFHSDGVAKQQSTVINLRFANRLCQIIQYSYLPKEDEAGERSDTLALKGFRVATSDKERD